MAYNRPTLQTLLQRILADINSRIDGSDSFLTRSVLGVIAWVVAVVAHGLYGHQAYTARQIIPDTADFENLKRQAFWLGRGMTVNDPKPATGSVTFTGSDGSVVPAGITLQRSDGVEYTTDAEDTISSGSVDIAVTATTTGQDTNASSGQTLNLVSPEPGVQSSATVATGGLTGGTDDETPEQLLARLKQVVKETPQGGSLPDYETWAKEVSGVTRVWPFSNWNGYGTVGVYFVRDDDASIIPDAAEVQAVQDYIDTKRPAGMKGFTAYAPPAAPIDMTIQLAPNDSTTQAAVESELQDLLRREANVEDGNGSGTILVSHIREAISIAAGETNHVLVTPSTDVTFNTGELPTLGTITWQAIP